MEFLIDKQGPVRLGSSYIDPTNNVSALQLQNTMNIDNGHDIFL